MNISLRHHFTPLLLLMLGLFGTIPTARAQVHLQGDRDSLIHERWKQGRWTATWVGVPGSDRTMPAVYHFRRYLNLSGKPTHYIVHISADHRYKFYVNGKLASLGPCRGDTRNWNYETVDLAPLLDSGANVLAAEVWYLGQLAPIAQMSWGEMGFLVQGNTDAEKEANTGAEWLCIQDKSYSPNSSGRTRGYWAVGVSEAVDARLYPHGWKELQFDDSEWLHAQPLIVAASKNAQDYPGRLLVPRSLPPMEMTAEPIRGGVRKWKGIADPGNFGKQPCPVEIPAHTTATLLLDQTYLTTGYPHLKWTGGKDAEITLTYAETLFNRNERGDEYPGGNRNEIEGKVMFGQEDRIVAHGGDFEFTPLQWRTWRYLQITVKTTDHPLTLRDISGTFSAYPFQKVSRFEAPEDPQLQDILDIGWRTARLCAHETYMDCPYYEQLQYFGDTRIQAMVTMYNTQDMPLVKQALEMGRMSMTPDLLTQSRYPSRLPQMICSYSLSWTGMIYDYWMYRGDEPYVASMLPHIRSIMQWYEEQLDSTGTLGRLPYWYFVDWAPNFSGGVPPVQTDGKSSIQDLTYLIAIGEAIQIEQKLGMQAFADHYQKLSSLIRKDFRKKYWSPERQLFADTEEKKSFSQHANILAILAGIVQGQEATALCERLLSATDISPATIYFRYFLFRAMQKAGLSDRLLDELDIWRQQIADGMTTWAEMPDPTRSECHAWGATPNIEFYRMLLGVDTDSPGFKDIRVAPALGKLTKASGTIAHPLGVVTVDYHLSPEGVMQAAVTLPAGTQGTFVWKVKKRRLRAGTNQLRIQ